MDLLHRAVPARYTDEGLRAVSGDRPIHPESVETYIESKFGDVLDEVTEAMVDLARSVFPSELNGKAYWQYETFRSEAPSSKRGWGAPGKLDLDHIRKMAHSKE